MKDSKYQIGDVVTMWSWSSSMFEDPSESINAFIRKKKCPELDFSL